MSAAPSARERWISAAALLLGVVFFTALGVGVVSAPMNMHPALGWLLRGFIGGMFGSLAGGALVGAVRLIRPTATPPAALLARCLGCGEPCAADAPCPVCALPPMDRRAAVTVSPARVIDAALLGTGASSLLCLGAFVAVGPWVDGERRAWVLCAMAALAVLLLLVGGAGFVGSILELFDRRRRGAALVARWSTNDRWLSGDGYAWGARVTGFDGKSERRVPLTAAGEAQGYRDLRDDTLAETLATLQGAGLLEIARVHGWSWSWGAGETVERSETREDRAELADVTRWREGGCYEAAANAVYRVIEDGASLWRLREELQANPALRAQWDGHAAALREAGVTTPPGLVEALAEALRAPSQPP